MMVSACLRTVSTLENGVKNPPLTIWKAVLGISKWDTLITSSIRYFEQYTLYH
jgi:hypothetical protein